MSIAANLLLNRTAAQRAVARAAVLMQGTRKGQQHTWSRSAYQHALAWQRGVASMQPLNSLARSYALYRTALRAAMGRVWRAHVRVQRAFARLSTRAVHYRPEYAAQRGKGMVMSMVPYRYATGGDGRGVAVRDGKPIAV